MKKGIVLLITICLMYSCSKDSTTTAPKVVSPPTAATLSKPEKNNTCVPVSTTSTTGVVRFEWAASQNTDSYTVVVANSVTNAEKKSAVSTTETTLTLDRGVPYSWWVLSDAASSTVTTKSEVWNFYLERVQEQSHFPFPAQLKSPSNNTTVTIVVPTGSSTGTLTLEWVGSDLDNDISHYQLYLGTSTSTLILLEKEHKTSSYNVSVENGKTYFWQIVTVDTQGNESTSPVESFKTSSP